MVKPTNGSIIIATVTMIVTILTLALPNIILNGFSENFETPNILPYNTTNASKENNSTEEIIMQVQLLPFENKYLKDWYQVSNFTLTTSNTTSKLCSSSNNCNYELENGKMSEASVPGERSLTGQLKVDTGISKQLMNLSSIWKAVEEFEKDNNKMVQIIEGTLKLGKDSFVPEHIYQINGTLSSNKNYYILEVQGKK
jgi:hypothetical protein